MADPRGEPNSEFVEIPFVIVREYETFTLTFNLLSQERSAVASKTVY